MAVLFALLVLGSESESQSISAFGAGRHLSDSLTSGDRDTDPDTDPGGSLSWF